MTAVVSVPTGLALAIGCALAHRLGTGTLPTKEAPEVGRVYLIVPLFSLSGLGLFDRPEIEIQYFATRAEAIAWGENDIEGRKARQRPDVFTRMLISAARVRAREAR